MPEVADSFWRIGDTDVELPGARARARIGSCRRHRRALPVIDPLIEDASKHWRLERMPVLDRLVLRLALYELLHEPSTPGAVVIDEALELTRRFSTEEAVPFVNGVLDAVKRRIERGEIAAGPIPS